MDVVRKVGEKDIFRGVFQEMGGGEGGQRCEVCAFAYCTRAPTDNSPADGTRSQMKTSVRGNVHICHRGG
jgi:hypothetical protein